MIRQNKYVKLFRQRLRNRRAEIFLKLLDQIDASGTLRVLDVGGTIKYWKMLQASLSDTELNLDITLANIGSEKSGEITKLAFGSGRAAHIKEIDANALDPNLYDSKKYDVIHSNSVIEHVGNWTQIKVFADNIVQSGLPYFIQTPNFWFPFEPHFELPFFMLLPLPLKQILIKLKFGGDLDSINKKLDGVRLLTSSEFEYLFCNAEIQREKVLMINKSFIATFVSS